MQILDGCLTVASSQTSRAGALPESELTAGTRRIGVNDTHRLNVVETETGTIDCAWLKLQKYSLLCKLLIRCSSI